MKEKTGPKLKSLSDNVTETKEEKQKATGNSRSYTLSRLQKQAPELFQAVCNGELSANAAAIQADIPKVKTPLEKAHSASILAI